MNERNKRFLFGKQVTAGAYKGVFQERAIKTYEKPYLDNVIKDGEEQIRSLIFSRMPDMIVQGGESETADQTAERLGKIIDKKLKSDEIKKILTRAFRHLPVYLTGVIKYRWDANKGKHGDVVFECVHPKNIDIDFTATENDERKMRIIVHWVEKPIKEWIRMFPKKEDEIMDYAQGKAKFAGIENKTGEKALAVNLKLPEVWYDWFEKEDDFDPEEPKYKTLSGVCWKMDKTLLDKRLNPNWDWDGEDRVFLNGQPIPEDVLPQIAMLGMDIPGIESEKVFRNYFQQPQKPFIFLGYDQWGEMAYDESSRIEDNLFLQQNYDYRGMQVTKMIDDARVKHAFSSMSGLKRETVEEMDLNDPDEDIFVDGDLRQVHAFIAAEQPSSEMFGDLGRSRERILSKVNIHGATRGEIQTSTATTNQIAREGDFTYHDNVAEDTVIAAATEIGEAYVHMMKLRYTADHFKAVLGEKADQTFENLTFDMIEDGMQVMISASGTDKLKRERQAKEEAQLQLIDPVNYYKDTGREDYQERAEMLFLMQNAPDLYYKKFVKGEDVPEIAEQLRMMQQQKMMEAQGMQPQQAGQPNTTPQQPSANNTGNIPTQPQGSPRGIMGQMGQAISGMFG